MKSIRCGSGLGDSLYLQAVARHLVRKGEKIEVCSDWPDVFRPLDGKVTVSPFRRQQVDIKAHYVYRKSIPGTNQFQDVCIRAGIREPVDFRLDWKPTSPRLVEKIRSMAPVVAVQLPRTPMDRKDGFGLELLPDCNIIQRALNRIRRHARIVQVGKGEPLHRFTGIDLNLANRTSVAELIDAVWAADAMLGYVSFAVPLAESLNKPALFIWSRRGLASQHEFIKQVTPRKILHRASSRAVFDDCPEQELRGAADALLAAIRSAELV